MCDCQMDKRSPLQIGTRFIYLDLGHLHLELLHLQLELKTLNNHHSNSQVLQYLQQMLLIPLVDRSCNHEYFR